DYPEIKSLIGESFGINTYVKDPSQLEYVLDIYLQECILSSTYSNVATLNGRVIGFILGSVNGEKKISTISNRIAYLKSMVKIIFSALKNRSSIGEFSKITDAYDELINGMKDKFKGCVQLFIVSKESQGLGIGKTLLGELLNHMKNKDVSQLYLYTDSNCNYGFYDSQGFTRIRETDIYFHNGSMRLDVFLYGYKLK
ncbi:MAG: GNAT family N-acetyltransferase, partial [Clostridium sp.]